MSDQRALHLAGITALSLAGKRGPRRAYLFDPHRLALSVWALECQNETPPLLVTFDRHFDLVPPDPRWSLPDRNAPLDQVDQFVRWGMGVRNDDHILTAMQLGLIGDAICIARASPRGAVTQAQWLDAQGSVHHLVRSPTLGQLLDGWGQDGAPVAKQARDLLQQAPRVFLDFDLDCFTSTSDADPTEILCWPTEVIVRHLMPEGSELFWGALLGKADVMTFAREPYHCGGVVRSARLFEEAAQVIFQNLFGAELP